MCLSGEERLPLSPDTLFLAVSFHSGRARVLSLAGKGWAPKLRKANHM